MNAFSSLVKIFKAINQHPLARKHKFRSYTNFIKWQMGQKFAPGKRKIHFLHGIYFIAKKGMNGITGNIYNGLHEFDDMGFLLHFLREQDLFVDIGANVGSYTLLSAGVRNATSIAFEPVPSTYKILEENIILNHLEKKTILFNKAAGKEKAVLKFTSGFDTINHAIPKNENTNHATIDVDVITIDSVIKPMPQQVFLIKMDAEGFETEVLNGMEKTLKNPFLKAIIMELNGSGGRYGFDESDIYTKMRDHSFLPLTYDPFTRKLRNTDVTKNMNVIFVRDQDFVNDRLQTAKKIKVFSENF